MLCNYKVIVKYNNKNKKKEKIYILNFKLGYGYTSQTVRK